MEPIIQGVKTSTMRATRKDLYVARPGETLYFYAGRRFSPNYRKIGEGVVTKVTAVKILKNALVQKKIVILGGHKCNMETLAKIEGFASPADMMAFFDVENKGDFVGHQYLFRMKTEKDYPQMELPMKARA